MRSFVKAVSAIFLLMAFLLSAEAIQAAAPTGTGGSAYVTDQTAPWDEIGKIGDRVSYTVLFTSDVAAPTPFVVLPGVGNPIQAMTVQNLGGTSFSANYTWTVVQGDVNNSADNIEFILGNTDGSTNYQPGGTVNIDNVYPNRVGIMSATVDGDAYTGTSVRQGQTVVFTQPVSTDDSDQEANLNLSAATGLSATNPMTRTGSPPTFTLSSIVFPDGIDKSCNFPITIVDGRGNQVVYNDFNMNVDTKAPSFTDKSVVNAAGAAIPALPGHVLNFSMRLQSYDNDVVEVVCASFTSAGITLPTLSPTATPVVGSAVTFTASLILTENSLIHGTNFPFIFRSTDNAGNVTETTAYLSSIDLGLPSLTNTAAIVYPPFPGIAPQTQLASISTQLQLKSTITADDDITVTANLQAIGGPAEFPMLLQAGNVYIGTYTIPAGTIENTATYFFNVSARDDAGNIVYEATTPGITIDNRPPDITAFTITRTAGAGTIRTGDSVTVLATVSNVEESLGGKVWADLQVLGGDTEHELENVTGNTWRAILTVATGTIDTTSRYFKLYAWDDVKNQDTFDSAAVNIDTEPPKLLLATYTSTPPQSLTHPYVIDGDVVKFQVTLASTTSTTAYDNQTVTIDLTSAGGVAAQVMTLQPSGIYTYDFTVPNNTNLTNGATFPVTIRDDAGNRPINTSGQLVVPTIDIPLFDQASPVISAFTVTRDAGAGTIRIGDAVTFEATVSNIREYDGGRVWSDFSAIGGNANTIYTNISGNTWRANVTVASGTIDAANHIFVANAYNRAEHQITRNSTATTVDNIPPVMISAGFTSTPAQSPTHPYVINGDIVKFQVSLASTTTGTAYDGQTVAIDLSSAGGEAAQAMTLQSTGIYTYDFTVPLGTLTEGATFPLIIRDNAPNGPFDVTGQSLIASISIPMFDQALPVISAFTVTRDAGAGTIHIGDTVTFEATIAGVLTSSGGTVWSDLSAIGGLASEPYTNVSGNIWRASITVASGTVDNPSLVFKVNAYNREDHQTWFNAAGTSVDNIPPVFTGSSYIVNEPRKNASYAIIEDSITVKVSLASGQTDIATVAVDLNSIDPSLGIQKMTWSVSSYTYTFTLASGTVNDGAILPLIITDNAGNGPAEPVYISPVAASITIPILDQKPPQATAFTVTRRAGAGIIIVGDELTFNATISDVEKADGGAVWMDLSAFGGPASATFANPSGNDWRYPTSGYFKISIGTGTIDQEDYLFSVNAYDKASNTHSLNTAATSVDIEPPLCLISTFTVPLQQKPPYVIIGDKVTIKVELASTTGSTDFDSQTVTVDLGDAGLSSTQALDLAAGKYSWSFDIPTGTLNLGATFPITITDDAGNTPVFGATHDPYTASVSIPLFDQNPPDPTPPLQLKDASGNSIGVVNLNTELVFSFPFTAESTDDDHATGTIDLTFIGFASDYKMSSTGSPLASYSLKIMPQKPSSEIIANEYKFTAIMYDKYGNKRQIQTTDSYYVDCWPPEILDIDARIIGGETVAHIGSKIEFLAKAVYNDSVLPTINLTSIGDSAAAPMTLYPSAGADWYRYEATIKAGDFNNETASWAITLLDTAGNSVSSYTGEITVDNRAPVNPQLAVSTYGTIKTGTSITFTVTVDDVANHGTATIDLSAIGSSSTALMSWDGAKFTLTETASRTAATYQNYVFTAQVSDANTNSIEVTSDPVTLIDCQPIIFSNHGIAISKDNSTYPVSGIANTGDELLVSASASAYVGGTIKATIGSGTTDIATMTMIYNSATNKHEATFTVSSAWMDLKGTGIYYKLTATDAVGNNSDLISATSSFRIRNQLPVINSSGLLLSSNSELKTLGGFQVYNLGSDVIGDELIASITFTENTPMLRAWLDFSELGSGTVEMQTNASSAKTISSIAVSKFSELTYGQRVIRLYALDEAGNLAQTSATFYVDNVAPIISAATFNGATITVSISEDFTALNAENAKEWKLIGSNTPPLPDPASMSFVSGQFSDNFDGTFDISLTETQKRAVVQWASTPVYLQATNVATYALTDFSGNELLPVSRYPVVITDSTWREPARITKLEMIHSWPTSIVVDIHFSKEVDPATLVASNGVLLVATLTTPLSYSNGYTIRNSDQRTWFDNNKRLRITLSDDGRDWVARKLGNNLSRKLGFASRSSNKIFVADTYGKNMPTIALSAPFWGSDNRPTLPFHFLEYPRLDLANRTLELSADDRLLLFTTEFKDNTAVFPPTLATPSAQAGFEVAGYKNKIVLHNLEIASTTTLSLETLEIPADNRFASTTVKIKLTDDDMTRVFRLFQNNTPNWRLGIPSDTFTNIWSEAGSTYEDESGNPGLVIVTPGTAVDSGATLAAAAMSDKPPVSQKTAGELTFTFEIFPPMIDGVVVPVQPSTIPKARIVLQNGTHIATGTFLSYSERTVAGKLRSVFTYTNNVALNGDWQREPATVELSGVKDILGNTYNSLIASYAYDLSASSAAALEGYSTASTAIVLDTRKPTVSRVIPGDIIGRLPAGSTFKVEFSEPMDTATAFNPVLALASDTLSNRVFTFKQWVNPASSASHTAEFTNNLAFDSSVVNGTWTYQISGGRDEAGNNHDNNNSFKVQVRTIAPEVTAINLRTLQNLISLNQVINQPWSPSVGVATFSISYSSVPPADKTHYLEIFDPDDNSRLGRVVISKNATITATATFSYADFYDPKPGLTGPQTYSIRVTDSDMNETDAITDIVYDNLAPDLTEFKLSSIGSTSANISYYNASTNFSLTVKTTTTDNLRLAISSNALATVTTNLTQTSAGVYAIATGSALPDGTYILTVVDMAGNHDAGWAASTLVVDRGIPSVNSISPEHVGNSPIGTTIFTVVYSEHLDTSLAPSLKLATGTTTINTTFSGWADSNNASTAYFINANAIVATHPQGLYTYTLSGGKDLAGNTVPISNDQTVEVHSQGPFAEIHNITDQSAVYGSANGLKNDLYFNGNGSATLTLDYKGITAFNTPHQLMVFDTSAPTVQVATFPVDNASRRVIFPDDADSGWVPAITEGAYGFRLIDNEGNRSSGSFLYTLNYDEVRPDVASISISGYGIATDTGTGLGQAWYYSPANGSATFSIITGNADKMNLLIVQQPDIATLSKEMSASADSKTHTVIYGGSLVDGIYAISGADMAGNLATGSAWVMPLVVDRVAPSVTAATPAFAGGYSAGQGAFELTFDKPMNTAIAPELYLSNAPDQIAMSYSGWTSSTTCRFTNSENIPQGTNGTWSYIISNARDLAGNPNNIPAAGAFEVYISTVVPVIASARLYSEQTALVAGKLENKPFSDRAAPGIATLSVTYGATPENLPHTLLVYRDSDSAEVASLTFNPVGSIASVTATASFFGFAATPANIGPASYSFRIRDSFGNISATSSVKIVYDTAAPSITATTATLASPRAWTTELYYNEQLHGNLKIAFTTTATDPLRLVLTNGLATQTYNMTSKSYTLPAAIASTTLAEGWHAITAADMAGNMAEGAASITLMLVDRTPPRVIAASTDDGLPVSSGAAGNSTFIIAFDEPLYQLASPSLTLATSSHSIACRFVGFVDPFATQAQFVTSSAVGYDIPQGPYTCKVSATDLTGNKISNVSSGTIEVRSLGPVVSSFTTRSYQSTTASSTLESGNEILLNQPFSFNVAPGAATMSIQLAKAPDTLPIHLHFTLAGETVASYTLPFDPISNAATFTWSALEGPVTPAAYIVRLADNDGDLSSQSHTWRLDNSSPSVAEPLVISGGEPATASVYFSPARHTHIATTFKVTETETDAPKLRIRSSNSTDTYELSSAGTDQWSGKFYGKYSRATSQIMPDGVYDLDMVDRAGNVALLSSGSQIIYNVIIDNTRPEVSTYSAYVASQPVSYYSPTAGNLDVFADSTESLSETGIFYMEITNASGIRIRKIPLVASSSRYLASWDAKNQSGNVVPDGKYTFRGMDYAGNYASQSISINTITSAFKVTSAAQVSSTSVQIWFNHDIYENSLTGSAVTASPSLTISNVQKSAARALSFNVASFTHQTEYTFTIANTVRSIYGANVTSTDNEVKLVADWQGPTISGVSFVGITTQTDFKVIFNEEYKPETAALLNGYRLSDANGNAIRLTGAIPQSDKKSVLMTAASALGENLNYTISATATEDLLGNLASHTYSFKGQDRTPPELEISAFSNPANENDIIVLVTSNELLKAPPTLTVSQSGTQPTTVTMRAGAEPKAFMAGVHLNPYYQGYGTLQAIAEDPSGNQSSVLGNFQIANVSANIVTQVVSTDSRLTLKFSAESLKSDATIKILKHTLENAPEASGTIRASLQRQLRAAIKSSQTTQTTAGNQTELVPIGEAYEIGIMTDKVNKGFNVYLNAPEATATTGLGLFNQSGDTWKFVSASRNDKGAFAARAISSQMFAIMRDTLAPRIRMTEELDLQKPFTTARPDFAGQIEESGSGVDVTALTAHIDGGPAQTVQVDSNGNFVFKPLADLIGGTHDLVIKAADRTGNQSQTSSLRFQVNLPLSLGQIMQYPNPATRRAFIRISANRGDLNEDLVRVVIYDVAGHKVTTLDNIRAVRETWGINSRYLYDIPWDLRNNAGKNVANGVYFAKIEVRDPENPSAKIKKNFKLAVLR